MKIKQNDGNTHILHGNLHLGQIIFHENGQQANNAVNEQFRTILKCVNTHFHVFNSLFQLPSYLWWHWNYHTTPAVKLLEHYSM